MEAESSSKVLNIKTTIGKQDADQLALTMLTAAELMANRLSVVEDNKEVINIVNAHLTVLILYAVISIVAGLFSQPWTRVVVVCLGTVICVVVGHKIKGHLKNRIEFSQQLVKTCRAIWFDCVKLQHSSDETSASFLRSLEKGKLVT